MTVSDLLEQPCNKSDNINKVVTSCSQFVPNLLTTWDKQCEDNLLTTCWQTCYTRKNAQVVTILQTSCHKYVHKLSTSCVSTACSQFAVTSLEQAVNNL